MKKYQYDYPYSPSVFTALCSLHRAEAGHYDSVQALILGASTAPWLSLLSRFAEQKAENQTAIRKQD